MPQRTPNHTVPAAIGKANGSIEEKTPLRVVIVGAGIGGLTAAIALRQQGHEVVLLEQSRFANELGAAVHLAPNCNGVLRQLGIFPEDFGANKMERLTEYTADGKLVRSISLKEANSMWQHSWLLAHRVQLHNALKVAATSTEGKGKAAELLTSSKVVSVDPEMATATLEDGRKFEADIIIGADGVHSKARKIVAGEDVETFSSGKSAFRFLFNRDEAAADPITAKFVREDGDLIMWMGDDRRICVYPTSANTQLNFVCIHPDRESHASSENWEQSSSRKLLLDVYRDFSEDIRTLISKANPDTLKLWQLLDMRVLSSWTKGRLALLGDAAHPFLPHQGQGAAQAIEDAAALATVLPLGTQPDEIAERLKLYERCRMDRANKIQQYTRMAGRDASETADGKGIDIVEYTTFNFGHDEFHHSRNELRKWLAAKNPHVFQRMPIGFGPMPGPRQSHHGLPRIGADSTFTTASIKFKTSRTLLQTLLPSDSFSFKSPATVCYASFIQTTLNGMEWLGGSGYNHFGLYIHGVQYKKRNGEMLNGAYLPVLFEDLADPILSGREELGFPKVYCDLDVFRLRNSYHLHAGWKGTNFAHLALEDLELVEQGAAAKASDNSPATASHDEGILIYKYIPAVGARGVADAEYPVFAPFAEDANSKPSSSILRTYRAKKSSIQIEGKDWDALPTLHHIVGALAEVPTYEIVEAKVVEGKGVSDLATARRIE
ncbi:MAG: hypothetical protein M1819_000454 [Sarea resinae]|nr:MAG: hypothetical protein M1819_000454 [Sarea resinae]